MRAADYAARKHTRQKRKGEEAEPSADGRIAPASIDISDFLNNPLDETK